MQPRRFPVTRLTFAGVVVNGVLVDRVIADHRAVSAPRKGPAPTKRGGLHKR